MEIKLEIHTTEVLKAMQEAVKLTVRDVVVDIANEAIKESPHKTGNNRRSIAYKAEGMGKGEHPMSAEAGDNYAAEGQIEAAKNIYNLKMQIIDNEIAKRRQASEAWMSSEEAYNRMTVQDKIDAYDRIIAYSIEHRKRVSWSYRCKLGFFHQMNGFGHFKLIFLKIFYVIFRFPVYKTINSNRRHFLPPVLMRRQADAQQGKDIRTATASSLYIIGSEDNRPH